MIRAMIAWLLFISLNINLFLAPDILTRTEGYQDLRAQNNGGCMIPTPAEMRIRKFSLGVSSYDALKFVHVICVVT